MTAIPPSVVQYVNDNSPYPAGLIGCRADSGQKSFKCCEYDIAIFCENTKSTLDRVITLKDITLEFIPFFKLDESSYIHIQDMIMIKDYDSFLVSSLLAKLREKKYAQLLQSYGKKKIIDSLFLIEVIDKNLFRCPPLSSLWLKIAAYHFIEGILALHGIKSSPVHELEQIRGLDVKRPNIASGINSALECIGIERAGRSAISRSLKVIRGINKLEFGSDLWLAKSQWLLSRGRVADCYHYIGKVAATYFSSKEEVFLRRYMRPIEILLDLTNDSQSNCKLHERLVKASKDALGN
jgi:hypothetical protein